MNLRLTCCLLALPSAVWTFSVPTTKTAKKWGTIARFATVAPTESSPLVSTLLEKIKEKSAEGAQWSEDFGLNEPEAGFFSVFAAIRDVDPLGLRGETFVLKAKQLESVSAAANFDGYFSIDDLAKACDDDFLDAGRGTTDNRKGWKVRQT